MVVYKFFFGEGDQRVLPDKDVTTTIFQMNTLKIPDEQDTNYLCKNFKLSALGVSKENHAVKIENIIDNQNFVHHMIIYACEANLDVNAPVYSCENMPKGCEHFQGWALGGSTYWFPDKVGYRMGGQDKDNFILQVHYENMMGLKNQYDSSGFKIYLTPHLREFDSGTMIIGKLVNEIQIPPQMPRYTVSGQCNTTCIDDFYIFGYGFHMHLLGRAINTEIHRDGALLSNIEDKDFDFKRGGKKDINPYIHVKKYDIFKINCHYNTMSKNVITNGGESTNDEMCFNFIKYYPKINGPKVCVTINTDKLKNYNYCAK